MTSWRLLRYLLPRQDLPLHQQTPIFLREMAYVPAWQRSTQIIKRIPFRLLGWIAILYIAGFLVIDRAQTATCLSTVYLLVLPVLLLSLSLLLWVLPLCVALSPVIVRERERASWELLCTTPYSVEEILLDKARAALWSLYYSWGRVGILQVQVLAMILLGTGFMQAVSIALGADDTGSGFATRSLWCGGSLVVVLIITGVFFFDRAQQLMTMATAALVVSALASSTRTAFTSALVIVFLVWGLDVAVAIGLLAIQPAGVVRDPQLSVTAVITLGPLAGYIIELPWLTVLLAIGFTLILREAVLRGLWQLAVRRASWL